MKTKQNEMRRKKRKHFVKSKDTYTHTAHKNNRYRKITLNCNECETQRF